MDTKHLEYFRIVYEEKSIHAAAKKLFISPQGLGKIIQNLEGEFKTPLFTRTKNGVFPTESGTLFYEQCVKTCRELKLLQTRMERMKKRSPVTENRLCHRHSSALSYGHSFSVY